MGSRAPHRHPSPMGGTDLSAFCRIDKLNSGRFNLQAMNLLRAGSGVCLIFLAAQSAVAVQLLRGPYLQMPTPSGVTIRWRTDTQTNSSVQFGTNLASLNLIAEN